jgi:5-methylcytosine-specific restriction endonuclease McrA
MVAMTTRNTTIRDRHRRTIAQHKPDCSLCGEPIDYTLPHTDPQSFVVDHIIPLDRGGIDELFNPDGTPQKQAAHKACNRAKSNTIPEGMEAPPRVFVTTLTW